jgi:hypothetical protein
MSPRRLAKFATLLFAILVVASCADNERNPPSRAIDMAEDITLQFAITVREGSCTLDYTLRNGSDSDLYLFTPITEFRLGASYATPNRVYVFWEDETTIHLTKRLWEVPDDVDVFMPEVPFLTKVDKGAEFNEQVELPLPLLVNFPYRFAASEKSESELREVDQQAEKTMFSIGLLTADGSWDESALQPLEGTNYFQLPYGIGISNQKLVVTKPDSISMPVKDLE